MKKTKIKSGRYYFYSGRITKVLHIHGVYAWCLVGREDYDLGLISHMEDWAVPYKWTSDIPDYYI